MAVTGNPKALSYSALADVAIVELEKDDTINQGDIKGRFKNHEQRITANEEGLSTDQQRLDDIVNNFAPSVEETGENITNLYNTVDTVFSGIIGKEKPEDYDELINNVNSVAMTVKDSADKVAPLKEVGFNPDTWYSAKRDIVKLDYETKALAKNTRTVSWCNVGVISKISAADIFKRRIKGNFAAIRGNLIWNNSQNPFTGWWFMFGDSGYGMICNLYTMEVFSIVKRAGVFSVDIRLIFKSGLPAISDSELFPEEKKFVDILMKTNLSTAVWQELVFEISKLQNSLSFADALTAAGFNYREWERLISDIRKLIDMLGVNSTKEEGLSVKSWRKTLEILLNRQEEMTDSERALISSLMSAGINEDSWLSLSSFINSLNRLVTKFDNLKITSDVWLQLLFDVTKFEDMDYFVKNLKNSALYDLSWLEVCRRLLGSNDILSDEQFLFVHDMMSTDITVAVWRKVVNDILGVSDMTEKVNVLSGINVEEWRTLFYDVSVARKLPITVEEIKETGITAEQWDFVARKLLKTG